MIDPTIWADPDFGKMSHEAQGMFVGIISNADDEGRLTGDALYLTSTIFPYKGYSAQKARSIRDEILKSMNSVIIYKNGNEEIISLEKFKDYQYINRPTPSKFPSKDDAVVVDDGGLTEDSVSNDGRLQTNRIEKNRIEKNRIEKKKHSHITDIGEDEFIKISKLYGLEGENEMKFIRSKYQDLVTYCESTGKKYKNYYSTLSGWVKRDAMKIRKESQSKSKITFIPND